MGFIKLIDFVSFIFFITYFGTFRSWVILFHIMILSIEKKNCMNQETIK